MTMAILFWCYKDVAVCVDRLRLLRHHNPDLPIYVLYGGVEPGAKEMADALAPFADDFWTFDQPADARWRWINGDRLIARWHDRRGRHLGDWTQLFVVQWDMLVAAPLRDLLAEMPVDAAVFTGRMPEGEVRAWWPWVRGPRNRVRLALFRLRLLMLEGYRGPVYTAPFIIVCAARAYFDRLARTPLPLTGFIEYRCVTFAEAWGFRHWTTPGLEAWRIANPDTRDIPARERVISAQRDPVDRAIIAQELERREGRRVFHPVHATDRDLALEAPFCGPGAT
jgi:hypothetical protein